MTKTHQKRMENGSRRSQTTMRIRPELIDEIRQIAATEDRSFGNVAERLMLDGLAKRKRARGGETS